MASDPKFVRLHNRLARGMDVDLASGFGISGLDIVPFPKDTRQAEYVRAAIRRGVYEEASDAEVEAFRSRETDFSESVAEDGHQEGKIQERATSDRLNIEGSRGLGGESSAVYQADLDRRKALRKAAKEADKGNTDKADAAQAEADAKAAEAAEAERLANDQAAGTTSTGAAPAPAAPKGK